MFCAYVPNCKRYMNTRDTFAPTIETSKAAAKIRMLWLYASVINFISSNMLHVLKFCRKILSSFSFA